MDEVLIKILGKAHVKKLHLRVKRPVGAAMDELLDTILNKASYTEIHLLLKLRCPSSISRSTCRSTDRSQQLCQHGATLQRRATELEGHEAALRTKIQPGCGVGRADSVSDDRASRENCVVCAVRGVSSTPRE